MGAREQALLLQQLLAVRRRIRAALDQWIRRWFAGSEAFRDADRDRFVREFTPVALGSQQTSALAMWTFQDQMLGDITGDRRPPAPLDVSSVIGEALRGVPPEVVYARPFTEIWRVLAEDQALREELLEEARQDGDDGRVAELQAQAVEDKPLTKAVTAGEKRARLLGVTDLELAEREAARQVLTTDDRAPRFYERVLTGDENCGLCVVASTQRYRRAELLPIHPGCDCVVRPLPDDARHVVDTQLLEAAHEAIAARFGISDRSARQIDYRKILLVRQHGELGPVLTVAKHRFTGPDDVDIPDQRSSSGAENRPPGRDVQVPPASGVDGGLSVAELVQEEPVSRRRLGGSTAYTDLVEYADGSQLIHKVNGSRATSAGYDPVQITDAEVLGARVLDTLGLRAAEVHRDAPTELWMEFIDGRLGGEAYGWADALPRDVLDSVEARRLGLADYLMVATDRNPGNWIVDRDGRLVGIDNGSSWLEGTNVDWPTSSPFARDLYERAAEGLPRTLAEQIDISAADLAEARRRLEVLRPEFEAAGRLDWLQLTLSRLDLLEQRATGTTDRLW